jgi:Zn-dependent metalloprotease
MIDDDVAAHEWTHGVTDYTSQLIYYYQVRAISDNCSLCVSVVI